ncbi:MAG TPA: hypothetical protein VJU18_04330 [Vicinamibacteria bacterium]|nr:hypothetical protein [Vicinamibacteria bacterium]
MAAIKGQPWDDWWDNLASQGNWTLPASRTSLVRDPQAVPPESAGLARLPNANRPPERISVPWREIEELHTIVNELDGERRRLADQVDLAQKVMVESTQLRASVEFLETENAALRKRLAMLEQVGRE